MGRSNASILIILPFALPGAILGACGFALGPAANSTALTY